MRGSKRMAAADGACCKIRSRLMCGVRRGLGRRGPTMTRRKTPVYHRTV
jgi:hypothetical protein